MILHRISTFCPVVVILPGIRQLRALVRFGDPRTYFVVTTFPGVFFLPPLAPYFVFSSLFLVFKGFL